MVWIWLDACWGLVEPTASRPNPDKLVTSRHIYQTGSPRKENFSCVLIVQEQRSTNSSSVPFNDVWYFIIKMALSLERMGFVWVEKGIWLRWPHDGQSGLLLRFLFCLLELCCDGKGSLRKEFKNPIPDGQATLVRYCELE